MRVAHVSAWYAPESWGGTEQYVEGLDVSLRSAGVASSVLVPGVQGESYLSRGVQVNRYREIAGFEAALRGLAPDVTHVHSWTPECGLGEVRAARRLGSRVVVTAHLPSLNCPRGTMLRFGSIPCDGALRVGRCAACWAELHGAPRPLAAALSLVPPAAGRFLAVRLQGRAGLALGATDAMARRVEELREVSTLSDRVVAVAEWLYRALLASGVPAERLACSRQGVDPGWQELVARHPRVLRGRVLRVLCLGRWSPAKGQHLLAAALASVDRWLPLSLTFCGPEAATPEDAAYKRHVLGQLAGDPRVVATSAASRDAIVRLLSETDVLAAPAQWLETGPLVVMEALAAGVPVLGSALGGIVECLANGGGALLPHDDAVAWGRKLTALALGEETLPLPPAGSPRTMQTVAREMVDVYERALAK